MAAKPATTPRTPASRGTTGFSAIAKSKGRRKLRAVVLGKPVPVPPGVINLAALPAAKAAAPPVPTS